MNSVKNAVLWSLVLSPMSLLAQSTSGGVDVSGATNAISSAATGAGTVIAAGLGFAALWIAYRYGKRIFGKA